MKYESEPSSGKYKRKVIRKRQDRLKRSEVNSKRYTLKEVQAKSESESSASSSEEEMIEVDEYETTEEYSSEQEQYSDNEEVSEDSAEQTREGEYPSDSETKKTKGFKCPGNERRSMKQ